MKVVSGQTTRLVGESREEPRGVNIRKAAEGSHQVLADGVVDGITSNGRVAGQLREPLVANFLSEFLHPLKSGPEPIIEMVYGVRAGATVSACVMLLCNP